MILTLLCLAFAGQEMPTYRMAGYNVPAIFVPEKSSDAQEIDGVRYEVSPDGKLTDSYVGNGRIDEILRLYAQASVKWTEKTPKWPVKIIIRTRGDVLIEDKILRQRRTAMTDVDLARVLGSVAQFCAMAEAYADGRFRVEPHIEVDHSINYASPRSNIREYLEASINGAHFDADDGVYRGPFGSVFVVDAALAAKMDELDEAHVLPYYLCYEAARPLALASRMLSAYCDDLFSAAFVGMNYAIARPTDGITDSIYARAIKSIGEWKHRDPRIQPTPPEPGLPFPDDPYAALPRISLSQLTDTKGTSFDLDSQASMVFRESTFQYLAVRWRFAPLFAKRLSGAHPIGIFEADQKPYVIFKMPLSGEGKSEAEWLGLRVPPAKPWQPKAVGNIVVAPLQEGWKLIPHPPTPWGGIIFLKRKPTDPIYVEFKVRAKNPVPMSFFADDLEHELFKEVQIPADGQWHTVKIKVGPVSENVGIGSTKGQGEREATWHEEPIFETKGWRLVENSDSLAEFKPALSDPKSEESIALAARKGDKALLKHVSELVRLNAAHAFSKTKDPTTVPDLIKLINSPNTRIGQVACRALAYQDTEEAKAALLATITNGANDLVRMTAAEALSRTGDKTLKGPLSTLLTGKSREARIAGIKALAKIPGKESSTIILAFLHDTDPLVRLCGIKYVETGEPLIRQRLQYYMINDPSEEIRSISALRLIASTGEERNSAMDILKEESGFVRRDFLLFATGASWPDDMRDEKPANSLLKEEEIEKFLKDPWPTNRALALKALSKTTVERLEPVLNDESYLVSFALVQLAVELKLALPQVVKSRLIHSRHRAIADKAKELPK